MDAPTIKLVNLSKSYRKQEAVNDFIIDIPKRELFGF